MLQLQAASLLSLSAALGTRASVPVAAADTSGDLIVQPATGVTLEQVHAWYGTSTVMRLSGSSQALVRTRTLQATLAAMRSQPQRIAWVESNTMAQQPRARDDSGADPHAMQAISLNNNDDQVLYRTQWGAEKASLDRAHGIGRGSGVVVAVLDTRTDGSHAVLAGRARPGIDVLATLPRASTSSGERMKDHGTMVAGIILRAAPEVQILPVRVLDEDGFGTVAAVAEGIRRAVDAGARVINLSLSTSSYSRVMEDAVGYARRKGAVLVAAYGNEETNSHKVYPADFDGVISVVATDKSDRRAPFSNYGRPGSVAAPGVQTVGAFTGNHYAYGDGTSFAAPWVAGQAALLVARGMRPDAVAQQIVGTADPIAAANGGQSPGYGRINVYRSLTETGLAPQSAPAIVAPVQTSWLTAVDGWDAKSGASLRSDGRIQLALHSDDAWLDIESGRRISFQFGGALPSRATVQEARIFVEHYEEEGIAPNSVVLQVGGGAVASPSVLDSRSIPVLSKATEAAYEWDVTRWITTGAQANDLKLVVLNVGTNGQKVKVDRVSLLVRFATV